MPRMSISGETALEFIKCYVLPKYQIDGSTSGVIAFVLSEWLYTSVCINGERYSFLANPCESCVWT